ncbi:MAG: TraU family protein [Desulfovibrio sp.]|jgi:conjugal transfer pilus assembly protein TraU|nr:TraU family protein [Desulfovibrio sp.]
MRQVTENFVMRRLSKFLAGLFFLSLIVPLPALAANPTCDPKFVNPFSDVEWNCMFPIRMAGTTVVGDNDLATPGKVRSPLCSCDEGVTTRIGITMGFREPARMLDVAKGGFCLNALGIDLGNSSVWGDGGATSQTHGGRYFAQVHYYAFLPLFLLELMIDFGCTEKVPLDVLYMSEFDPTHANEELGLVTFPETILFSATPLILACIADAMSTSLGAPLDPLFWCAGAWGTMYPMSGYSPSREPPWVEASGHIAAKFLARAHRLLIAWGTSGEPAMCGMYPMPVIRKTQYKLQLVRPVRSRQCVPLGKTGMLWVQGKNPPVPGKADNFSYFTWRWRDCCAF